MVRYTGMCTELKKITYSSILPCRNWVINDAVDSLVGKCVAFGVILAGDFYLLFFVCVYVCNIAEVRFGFNCQVKKQIQEAGFLCDHDLDSGTTMNKKIRNAQLAQYNFIFGQ